MFRFGFCFFRVNNCTTYRTTYCTSKSVFRIFKPDFTTDLYPLADAFLAYSEAVRRPSEGVMN